MKRRVRLPYPAQKYVYVYVLQSLKDFRTYVGVTGNFERRFELHNLGRVVSTKYRVPFRLLFKEEFVDSKDAKSRELW